MSNTTYGKRKLGAEEYAAQSSKKKAISSEGVVYGKRKTAGDEPPAPVERNPFLLAADKDSSGYVNLKEMEATLTKQPELLDAAIEAEFRKGTPRKGALALFTEVENGREGGPRSDVIELLAMSGVGGSAGLAGGSLSADDAE
jgi:hypothetical protein